MLLSGRLGRSLSQIRDVVRGVRPEERVFFDVGSIYSGHTRVTYRGVPGSRCPFDYVMYQMLISDLNPDLIIEVGTRFGGGALYLADLLQIAGQGMVHTIDIEDRSHELLASHPRIRRFTEGWEGYDVSEAKGFPTVLVIDDASHSYQGTLGALRKFAPLVSVGSYFVVEDGIVNDLGLKARFDGGPLRAIREFLVSNAEFVVDRGYCDMFGKNATFNVNGYLRKVLH